MLLFETPLNHIDTRKCFIIGSHPFRGPVPGTVIIIVILNLFPKEFNRFYYRISCCQSGKLIKKSGKIKRSEVWSNERSGVGVIVKHEIWQARLFDPKICLKFIVLIELLSSHLNVKTPRKK